MRALGAGATMISEHARAVATKKYAECWTPNEFGAG